MAEITRVPLQPIEKGSLTKLWLGVLVALLVGVGAAWWVLGVPSKVEVVTVKEGSGPNPTANDVVLVNYTGKLASGKVFDEGHQAPLPLDSMIPGFTEAMLKTQKGGKYTIKIPAKLGYGAEEKRNPRTGEVVIPANSDLEFDVELLDFISKQQFEQMMQQMQMMQAQGGGMPGGPPRPPQPGQ